MADAKIEITIGGISFSGEGEETWLANQLDKFIDKAAELINIAPSPQVTAEAAGSITSPETTKQDAAIAAQTLPNFLKSKNATKSAQRKFLATAIWLHAKGKKRLIVSDIIKALKDSNQSRLGNASAELARHVTKGTLERDGSQFFVTEHGKASL